jgi:hypothetical protein
MRSSRYGVFSLTALLVLASSPSYANDSAASRAVGGIQLRREAHISMEKELLTISEKKITVEYEFLNEDTNDISTEVAFPIPPYDVGYFDAGGTRDFADFRLYVEGRELKYNIDVRARLGDVDHTELLKTLGIDIASFGEFDYNDQSGNPTGQIAALTPAQRQELVRTSLIQGPDDSPPWMPNWEVLKTYHWTQTFSARKILRIRHEYHPSIGFTQIGINDLNSEFRRRRLAYLEETRDELLSYYRERYAIVDSSCPNQALYRALKSDDERQWGPAPTTISEPLGVSISMGWVDYVLTTANSWKTPIKEFTMYIEKTHPGQFVSLCWNGQVTRVDANRFIAHETNFVPTKELRIAFLSVIPK